MSGEGQQQQQQQQQQQAATDFAPAFAKLTPENLDFVQRKGWAKEGKPVEGFDLNAVLGSYHGLEKLQGKNTLEAPDLSSDEAFGKWPGHKLLGVPENADGYKFERPKMPDGVKYDEDGEKALRAALSKGKIGQKQGEAIFKDLIALQTARAADAIKARADEFTAMDAELRKEWGQGYDAQKAAGGNALKFFAEQLGIADNVLVDTTAQVMGNAVTAKLFAKLASMLGEDKLKGGAAAGFATGPAAALAEIRAMEADVETSRALTDARHPGHKAAVEKRTNLFKIAYPD